MAEKIFIVLQILVDIYFLYLLFMAFMFFLTDIYALTLTGRVFLRLPLEAELMMRFAVTPWRVIQHCTMFHFILSGIEYNEGDSCTSFQNLNDWYAKYRSERDMENMYQVKEVILSVLLSFDKFPITVYNAIEEEEEKLKKEECENDNINE